MHTQSCSMDALPSYQPTTLFGLPIYRGGRDDLLNGWARVCRRPERRYTAFFANAHTINTMYEKEGFLRTMRQADMILPDGIGVDIAAWSTGQVFAENLCGTDLIIDICKHPRSFRVFLLGSEPGVAEDAAACFRERYGANIVGTHHGYLRDASEQALEVVWKQIADARPDIVLVGMGQPLQEEFVVRYRHKIQAPITAAVGGLFDYYSGRVRRAPVLWRKCRMEWLYRMIQEPRRLWKRYILGNPLFLLRTARMAMGYWLRRRQH